MPNYADDFPALARLRIPFRLGVVQHGLWPQQDEQRLVASPWYRGVVAFMLHSRQQPFHALKNRDHAR
ncbi:hypothetical protein [Erwinia amylovora]|uniref:hypothetical protein n=1 Tax=Erwinia amylovora TaxID=552 RepID=UPI001D092549|nr:hypothetical protein [Erwinia amylovora]